MNNSKLTPEQIDSLFDFCRKHYVQHYDVQVELVDHLASSIEQSFIQNPNISFENALAESFNEFGIFGFSKIKVAKEKAMEKKYNRLLWNFVGGYFKLPQFIVTLVCTLIVFSLFHRIENDSMIILAFLAILFLFEILYHFYIFPKYLKVKTNTKKTFLINETLRKVNVTLVILPSVFFQLTNLLKLEGYPSFSWWFELLISFLVVVCSILVFAYSFYLPKKINEHFSAQFPQFIRA